MGSHGTTPKALGAQVEWIVEGQPVVIAWKGSDSCGDVRRLGLFEAPKNNKEDTNDKNEGVGPALWVGCDVQNSRRMLVCIRVAVKIHSSTSRRYRDMFFVLPVENLRLARDDSMEMFQDGLQHDMCSHLGFSLLRDSTSPYVVMPVPRHAPQKPLGDMSGHLVRSLQELLTVPRFQVCVDGADLLETLLPRFEMSGDLESLRVDLKGTFDHGFAGGVNRWDMYPVTSDSLHRHLWNPPGRDFPPSYSPSLRWDAGENIQLGTKRKASASPPRDACPRPTKAGLEALAVDEDEGDTERDSSGEMLKWAEAVRAELPGEVQIHPYTPPAYHQQDSGSIELPSISAPGLFLPATAVWRKRFDTPSAVFLDVVLLLKQGIRSDPRCHVDLMEDFLALGFAARLAVKEFTTAQQTTPAQESRLDFFTRTRHRVARRLIENAADDRQKPPSPWPRGAVEQVDYVRGWLNQSVEQNCDLDIFDELTAMQRAAQQLANGRVLLGDGPPHDPLVWAFELSRATCLAAAFFKLGHLHSVVPAEDDIS
ncbi:uncharacterized protein BKA78DRAFT_47631 [Phyllosticta capitalensis]|uniref:uncharacterized protein n=1 Tax=Phyllosticta capitalensis TaxID=121624 RepID=UPI003132225A